MSAISTKPSTLKGPSIAQPAGAETITDRLPAIGPVDRFVFDRAPLLVYWEATRACDLACIHCRAEAVARRHPLELRTVEVQRLFQQIADFGGPRLPHLIITGGDPLCVYQPRPLS